ncbi:MAG TPA: lantibiotic dehydratase [Ktedonobacteraceae bacterium]|nr:lantibiotic dehydratase [Ktedonobacteraceae bacterium]
MLEQKQAAGKEQLSLYAPVGFFMLRAPAFPTQVFTRLSTTGHISNPAAADDLDAALRTRQDNSLQLLQELAARPEVIQAVAVASPSLWNGLERLARHECSPAQEKKIYSSLLRYLIRMSTRPTPFGLFSGVACGTFADETLTCLTSRAIARFRTRPDMHWLLAILQRVEEERSLVAQLKVRFNQAAYFAGKRMVLPFTNSYDTQDIRSISLSATQVVRTVFELTQQFIPYTELQQALQQAFPRTSIEQIDRVLWQLWEKHFLISLLHPPMTDARPAEYVLKQLDHLPGVDTLKGLLARVLQSASTLDNRGIGAPSNLISPLVEDLEKLAPTASKGRSFFQVDATLDVKSPTLCRLVGQTAAYIAQFLLRQSTFPQGSSHLQKYRTLFLEKYGTQVEVPLLDLLGTEDGLGIPPGYENPPDIFHSASRVQPATSDLRDRILLQLVVEAVNNRSLEVELTEEIQQRLERWSPQMQEAPLSLEIYLQLHASSREALDSGEWTAVMGRNCGYSNGGGSFGRFFDLLRESEVECLRHLARLEESLLPDVIFAELSYQPLRTHWANVVLHPLLRSYEIAVGTTPSVPPECVLALSDLVVGVHKGRFYLRSLRLGKQVRVCQSHVLDIQVAPNVCRFLLEIANDGQPTLTSFDWGAAADAPFLPRLVLTRGSSTRVVITPACWKLQAENITPLGDGSFEARWFRGLQQWREQWRVPRYVYLTRLDNRLLLDLENSLMVAELRHELSKHNGQEQITLDELLPDFEHLWLRDEQGYRYFSEIVVPLVRSDAVDPAMKSEERKNQFTPPQRAIASTERKRFPGEEWTYLKLYSALEEHERLLAGPVRELVQTLQEREMIDLWFFIRYADPQPHLRLRFHSREAVDAQALLATVLPWSLQLTRYGQIQRYMLDTYEREIERYGGPDAIDLLEQVFSLDSAMVTEILASRRDRRLTLDPLSIAIFTLDHFFASWGCDLRQRLEWTQQVSEKSACSKEFHSRRKHYSDLLAPGKQIDPQLTEQCLLLHDLIHPQEPFLNELGRRVHQLAEAQKLWVSETSLLSSLAHMHLNRLLNMHQISEEHVYAFWRHTLNSLVQRCGQQSSKGGCAL